MRDTSIYKRDYREANRRPTITRVNTDPVSIFNWLRSVKNQRPDTTKRTEHRLAVLNKARMQKASRRANREHRKG